MIVALIASWVYIDSSGWFYSPLQPVAANKLMGYVAGTSTFKNSDSKFTVYPVDEALKTMSPSELGIFLYNNNTFSFYPFRTLVGHSDGIFLGDSYSTHNYLYGVVTLKELAQKYSHANVIVLDE